MQILEFNKRPLLLKADKVSKRDKQILSLLIKEEDIYYPYEVEMSDGECVTKWRTLTPEEAQLLLDNKDTRPLVERLAWGCISDYTQNHDNSIAVKRIAPIAHLLFRCTLVDEDMYVSSYNVMLSFEDIMYLVEWVLDHEFGYSNNDLKNLRPELYKRITAKEKLPKEINNTSVLLLTTAECIARKMMPERNDGDRLYESTDESGVGHFLTLSMNSDEIEIEESILATEFPECTACFVADTECFCSFIGAYLWDSLHNALNAMYSGKDATLGHLMALLDNYAFGETDD